MHIKLFVLFLFFLSVIYTETFANDSFDNIVVLQEIDADAPNNGDTLLLWNRAKYVSYSGDLVCVGSDLCFESGNGNIWLIFSSARIGNEFDGEIYCLFSSLYSANPVNVSGFFNLPRLLAKDGVSDEYVYDDSLRPIALCGIISVIKTVCVLLAGFFRPGFIKQAAGFTVRKTGRLIASGLLCMLGLSALILIFTVSVIGLPVVALILIGWLGISIYGEAAVSASIGHIIAGLFGKVPNTRSQHAFAKIIIGVIIMETICFLPNLWRPFVGFVALIILSIIYTGAVVTAIYEGFIKKNFLEILQ